MRRRPTQEASETDPGPTRRSVLRGAASLAAALGVLTSRRAATAAPAPVNHHPASDQPPAPAPAAATPAAGDVVAAGGPARARAGRMILPMTSGFPICRGQFVTIRSRPGVAFRPERLIIGGTPGEWIVDDVRIGKISQLRERGETIDHEKMLRAAHDLEREGRWEDAARVRSEVAESCGVPGSAFSASPGDSPVKTGGFDVCRIGVDLEIDVTFVGSQPGAQFYCGVIGDGVA